MLKLKTTIISVLKSLVKNRIYISKRGLAKGLKLKSGLLFIPRRLTREEKFVMNLDINGQTIYDIGGECRYFHHVFCSGCREEG